MSNHAPRRQIGPWLVVAALSGAALLAASVYPPASYLPPAAQDAEQRMILGGGLGLLALAVLVFLFRRPLAALLGPAAETPSERETARPLVALFLISFVVLFVELMLIRYCSAQIRIFAFYKNVPLVSCFLGLGLGCWLGGGRPRHVLAFLLWLVPLAVFLSTGTLALDGYLGVWAAAGSSEHILGDAGPGRVAGREELLSQLLMGLFCVVLLVVIAALFALLGRLLGAAFERVPRLPGYTANILGSLAGILGFTLASVLETPPWAWFLIGLLPLVWWTASRRQALAAAGLAAASALAVAPSVGDTVWSPYQKLVGFEIPRGTDGATDYLVQISDVFYQVATDLRPEAIAKAGGNRYPHYDGAYRGLDGIESVLIVGAGTGNDVAAALRKGVARAVAVDIDPAIVAMGRAHHPEAPYADPRVEVVVNDARRAFHELEPGTFDAVVFGLLDSHTQLGISSVRLDNYVFTLESFDAARRLLKPGGYLIVTAATFRDWFAERLLVMLARTCASPVEVAPEGVWKTFRCRVGSTSLPADALVPTDLPTDDWPFLYLPERKVPGAYLLVVGMLALASIGVLRAGGLELGAFSAYHTHLFFLGAAFLLMEVYAINRLALLFGTTWLVSAVSIALVLTLIVLANLTVALWRRLPELLAYGGLTAMLLVSYGLDPSSVLGRGWGAALGYGLLATSPIYFGGLIFARSFKRARLAGPAIGANILGAVLGGWIEYLTMAVGIRAMVLLALVFYLASLLGFLAWRRGEAG